MSLGLDFIVFSKHFVATASAAMSACDPHGYWAAGQVLLKAFI
jgi:hypothetical protein